MHFSVSLSVIVLDDKSSAKDTKYYRCMQLLTNMKLQLHFHSYFFSIHLSSFFLKIFCVINLLKFLISIYSVSQFVLNLLELPSLPSSRVNLLSHREPLQPLLQSCFSQVLTTLLWNIKLKGYDKQLKGTPWKKNKGLEKKCSTSNLKATLKK